MPSLHSRVILAALLVLSLFLGLTGWTLDRAFRESAEVAVRERLQAQVYGLLAAADLDADDRLTLPDSLPEERFQRPGSGLYAQVVRNGGEPEWRSPSQLAQSVPAPPSLAPGQWRFARVRADDGTSLFQLAFGIAWEVPQGTLAFTVSVSEDLEAYTAQVARFRGSLWTWFTALAVGLLVTLGLVLRWGLRPLQRVAHDLAAVERGERSELTGRYPRELRGLTASLNALLMTERGRLQRYRDGLADLAHSLKTPIAILRGGVDGQADDGELRELIGEQTRRMGQIVDYQLQRAATAGRATLMTPLAVKPLLQRLQHSLQKVHGPRGLTLELRADDHIAFRADESDLMEVCGNLIDNACKWARSRVLIQMELQSGDGRPCLAIEVEDDGPGIPEAQRAAVLERGTRIDSAVPGQGIGLAVVRDIAAAYGGTVEIDASEALGGARVRVMLCSG